MEPTIPHFLSMLFWSRNQAHLWHFQTNRYSEHKAIEEYYSSVNSFIDTFAEGWMSDSTRPGGLSSPPLVDYESTEKVKEHIKLIQETAKSTKGILTSRSDLINLIDELLLSTNKVLYLLTLG